MHAKKTNGWRGIGSAYRGRISSSGAAQAADARTTSGRARRASLCNVLRVLSPSARTQRVGFS